MSACVPTRASDPTRTQRIRPPHSPPPHRHRRFHIAGADVSASIAVFLIALPLSLGIALATGAPLQAGLVAAAVGGLVAGWLGGAPLQAHRRPTSRAESVDDHRPVIPWRPAYGWRDNRGANLVPPPGEESGDDSVAAAIEYAVDVLKVRSITVCGHSGCGAMQALLSSEPGGAQTPLKRWLRHGLPSLERMADGSRPWARLAGRAPADAVEQLCLTNVVQQLDHLRAHESVARALRAGVLELHGMYFHVGEAQAYLLTGACGGDDEVFDHVGVADVPA
ncbi:hypothetical protein SAURM35S_01629 [Streptomyces aurantiogriseus]